VPYDHEEKFNERPQANRKMSSSELDPKSHNAFAQVQQVLLTALQTYWLPSYILHLLYSLELEVLEVAKGLLFFQRERWLCC
jgi:hypothetical protein